MTLSTQTQAVLLLTAHLGGAREGGAKPLTPTEWGRFAQWLKDRALSPDRLLIGNLDESLMGWEDKKIDRDRLRGLLDRGSALALATEKWLRAGLWILTRSDPDYPSALKQRLKTDAPPVLFGCGSKRLPSRGGIAVVGSRNAGEADLAFARGLGALASRQGESIVSGGARGIDEAAMLGALEAEGTAVGILADSLLRACTSKKYRPYLLGESLTLLSPYNPEAGFNAGNAMARNKYIYCLSAAAIVVHSGTNGGTWNGAVENLKKGWVPLGVKQSSDAEAGNARLVALGGQWLVADLQAIDMDRLKRLFTGEAAPAAADALPEDSDVALCAGLADAMQTETVAAAAGPEPSVAGADSDRYSCARPDPAVPQADSTSAGNDIHSTPLADTSFYDLFLAKVEHLCSGGGMKENELAEALGLTGAQLKHWLSRAVHEERLRKSGRPIRYEWRAAERQMAMQLH